MPAKHFLLPTDSWPYFITLVLILLVLAACELQEDGVQVTREVMPTKVVVVGETTVPTQPPATVLATSTQMPISVPEDDFLDDRDPLPTATLIPTPVATFNSFGFVGATPEPPHTLELPTGDIEYRLKPPSVDALLESLKQSDRIDFAYDRKGLSWDWNRWQLLPFINSDLQQFFADNIPPAQELMVNDQLLYFYAGQSLMPVLILEDGFVQYLNGFSTDLDSIPETGQSIEFSAQPIELGQGSQKSWIVTVDFLAYHVRSFMLITQLKDGTFKHLPDDLPDFSGRFYEGGDSTVSLSYDLTGDGLNEVLVENWAYLGGGGNEKNLSVYTWTGQSLGLLENINMSFFDSQFFEPTYEIADFNGDSHEDIRVVQQHALNFGCAWESTDIYSWQGTQSQHLVQDDLPPDTAVCNLWRVMVPFNRAYSVSEADKTYYLERAINQLRTDPTSEADWLAYALFQLAMVYMENGESEQARATVNQIYSLLQSSKYAQFIQANESENNDSVISLCRNVVMNAEQALETNIGHFLTQIAIRGVSYDQSPERSVICDLRKLIRGVLQHNALSVTQEPIEMLDLMDIHHSFFESGNLDSNDELEWIGVIEPEAPSLVIFDSADGAWQVYFISDPFYFPILEFSFEMRDIIGDEQLETIVLLTEDRTAYYTSEEIGYDIILLGAVNGKLEQIANVIVSDGMPILNQLDGTFFNLNESEQAATNWRTLEGFPVEADYISSYVSELQTAVLIETDPDIPNKIMDLLNYLPSNDPDTQPYREHLTYLLGYYYEVSEEEETAVTTYLSLIHQAPTSPWAWLAWARLEPAN